MKNFEENLQQLEQLSEQIKQSDISLEDALDAFEKGIKLSKEMEKELDQIESKVQILMNSPSLQENKEQEIQSTSTKKTRKQAESSTSPVLDLFNGTTEINGTRNA